MRLGGTSRQVDLGRWLGWDSLGWWLRRVSLGQRSRQANPKQWRSRRICPNRRSRQVDLNRRSSLVSLVWKPTHIPIQSSRSQLKFDLIRPRSNFGWVDPNEILLNLTESTSTELDQLDSYKNSTKSIMIKFRLNQFKSNMDQVNCNRNSNDLSSVQISAKSIITKIWFHGMSQILSWINSFKRNKRN